MIKYFSINGSRILPAFVNQSGYCEHYTEKMIGSDACTMCEHHKEMDTRFNVELKLRQFECLKGEICLDTN